MPLSISQRRKACSLQTVLMSKLRNIIVVPRVPDILPPQSPVQLVTGHLDHGDTGQCHHLHLHVSTEAAAAPASAPPANCTPLQSP